MCKDHHSHSHIQTHTHDGHSHAHPAHTNGEELGTCACGCHHHAAGHSHALPFPVWSPMLLSALLLLCGIFINPLPQWPWIIFLLSCLPVGLPVVRDAWHEVREGNVFNEFTLMLIAGCGAFVIGEYPEAVAILLFYSAGEYFQEKAVGRARRDIRALVSLRPDSATVVRTDGSRYYCAPEDVVNGMEIEVKPGGRVPVDGILLSADADFDTAALTGESIPRTCRTGQEVSAGMISLSRVIRLRVIRPYAESALQRILNQVEEAARHKAPAERFIRRFARVYTPIVLVLAVLTALLPPLLFSAPWSVWCYRALVFLVISCPCALVVSVPLSYFRGIGVASRHGILFKGGNYLDAVTRLRCIAFDKTGTLTTGHLSVERLLPTQGFTADRLLAVAASLEQGSSHPIARAVSEAFGKGQPACAQEVHEEAGNGLSGMVDDQRVWLGNEAFLRKNGIMPAALPADADSYTAVGCAVDSQFAGYLLLQDRLRPEVPAVMQELRRLGVRLTCMLSGDRMPVARTLAAEAGLTEVYGDLLPADKTERLRQLKLRQPRGGVAFVGDGINDAPVLAAADVGMAMGHGASDAAVETADVVLRSSSLQTVADALRIGRATRRVVRLNIALAIGVKLAVLLAGTCGMAGLWAAVLADTGVALLCVGNTWFIRK